MKKYGKKLKKGLKNSKPFKKVRTGYTDCMRSKQETNYNNLIAPITDSTVFILS